jgi:hypothetical protein
MRRSGATALVLWLLAGLALAAAAVLPADSRARLVRAVIVDQLSLTSPNPDFAAQATDMLERAGYAVDYVPGERVTVDFYRALPEREYGLLIFRTHGGRSYLDGLATDNASLFTSEPYTTTRYAEEQRDRLLTVNSYGDSVPADTGLYFGIPAGFVTWSMHGDLEGATVILMGCDVLRGEGLAGAFVSRGAGAVVGWDGPVSAAHTDAATLLVLRQLLRAGLPAQEATAAAMAELGPDPFYDSALVSYRPEG